MAGNLFTPPKAVPIVSGAVSAGAKLYFYQTGTTTDESVYTDVALSVAHDQPVVADSAGVFAPIYMNPDAGQDYRVKLTDSADVLIYQVDDYPAGFKAPSSGSFTGTLTGCTTSPTGTVNWERSGNKVTLIFGSAISGTSNSTAMTITGLPAAIRASTLQQVMIGELTDNSVGEKVGAVVVGSTDTITFRLTVVSGTVVTLDPAGFTASGTKGLGANAMFTYDLG